jgi:hypothetical protein
MGVHGAVIHLLRLRLPAAVAAVIALVWPAQAIAMSGLVATVRANGTTTLVAAGRTGTLTTLRHGTYALVIHDRSRHCGFRLEGAAGLVVASGARFVGDARKRVVFSRGTYTYSCGGGHRHTLRVT